MDFVGLVQGSCNPLKFAFFAEKRKKESVFLWVREGLIEVKERDELTENREREREYMFTEEYFYGTIW